MGPALIRARKPFMIKNIVTGIGIASFVIGVYAFTIKAVAQDDFSDVQIPDVPEQPPHTPHTGALKTPPDLAELKRKGVKGT
ncbi:MAG: hypothetical protein LQ350_003832 [Teloschistes chrysophthalmus]|nr:MAG: hypothetical protein LQ350_003832 [Niorma chrysophthalma]